MLLQKKSFLFLVAAAMLVGSQSYAGGLRCRGGWSSGWMPVESYCPSEVYSTPRYYSSKRQPCVPEARTSEVAPSSGYRRYATFEGGWVLVDQNDFIVDSSERRANGIYPAQPKRASEKVPAVAPQESTKSSKTTKPDRDLLSAPKRNQEAPSRYEGVDFFNAPKR